MYVCIWILFFCYIQCIYMILSHVKHLTDKYNSVCTIWQEIIGNCRKNVYNEACELKCFALWAQEEFLFYCEQIWSVHKGITLLKRLLAHCQHSLCGVPKCSQHWRNTCEAHRSQIRQPLYRFLDSQQCNYNWHDVTKLHTSDLWSVHNLGIKEKEQGSTQW